MRPILALAALLALSAPSAGRAAERLPPNGCGQICAKAEATCHDDCKGDKTCMAECDENLESCRATCELGVRYANDPKRILQEVRTLQRQLDERERTGANQANR